MAKESTEAAGSFRDINSNSTDWQQYIEGRVRENIMAIGPQMAESLGLKPTTPTLKTRAKMVGAIIGVAAVGGAIGATTVLLIQKRRNRLAATVEFDKDLNGHNRVRPVGSRAASLAA